MTDQIATAPESTTVQTVVPTGYVLLPLVVPASTQLRASVAGVQYLTPISGDGSPTLAAILHALFYGWQRKVNDRTGGKDKTPEAKATIAKAMLASLCANPFVARKVGLNAVEPIVAFIRRTLRTMLAQPANAERAKAYKALKESDDREQYLDDWFAGLGQAEADVIESVAQKALDRDIATKAANAADIAALAAAVPSGIPAALSADQPTAPAPVAELIPADKVETPAKVAARGGKRK